MELVSLELQGFGSYKEYSCINFHPGLTSIHGVIQNNSSLSNGAGKSTLMLALLFALYGEGKFDVLDDIWNCNALKSDHVFVRLCFRINEIDYVIDRGRKRGTSYLDFLRNGERLGSSIREAQDLISSVLGMDHSLFVSSVFVKQGDLYSFIDVSPAERREFLDRVLGLELWRSAYRNAYTDLSNLQTEYDNICSEILQVEQTISSLKDSIEQIKDEVKSRSQLEMQLNQLEQQLEKFQYVSSIKEKIASIEDKYLPSKQKELERLFETLEGLKSQEQTIATTFENVSSQYCSYGATFESDVRNSIDKLTNDILTKKQEYDSVQVKINQRNKDLIEIDSLIASYVVGISEGICIMCKQPITQDYINQLSIKYENERRALEEKKKVIVEEINSLQHQLNDIKVQIDNDTNLLMKYNEDLSKFSAIKSQYESIAGNYNDVITKISDQMKSVQDSIAVIKQDIHHAQNNLVQLRVSLKDYADIDISSIKEQRMAIQKRLSDILRLEGELKVKEDLIDRHVNLQSQLHEKKKNIERMHSNLKYVVDIFRDIPTYLFRQSIVLLEMFTNEILRTIFPNFSVQIYEDLEKKSRKIMIVFNVGDTPRKFNMLSGGEAAICALSIRLGLSRLIRFMKNSSVNFIVLDEIFGSLDQENRRRVFEVLSSLCKYFAYIFVITHTEDNEIFPNNIVVMKDELGNSSILSIGGN